jgi:hypothetical protein
MTDSVAKQDGQTIEALLEAALALARAEVKASDGVRVASLPQDVRRAFGNRATIRYTYDRDARKYHANVEYATLGSSVVTQAIQFIREQTSIVHSGPPDPGRRAQELLRDLVEPTLSVVDVRSEPAEPHFFARALVAATMLSDDRRTFLEEVIVPLGDSSTSARSLELVAAAVPLAERAKLVPVPLGAIIDRVLDRAQTQIGSTIKVREEDLDAQLQDAMSRLGPGSSLEALRTDLALTVQLDVAYLEVVRLGRETRRGKIVEPSTGSSLTISITDYEGVPSAVRCSSCTGMTSRLDLCRGLGWHLICPACAVRCSGCSARQCRQHPTKPCSDPSCHGAFCGDCLVICTACGRGSCPEHRTICTECGEASCTSCQDHCTFHAEVVHRTHLQSCRACRRLICTNHLVRCPFDEPGAEPLCGDHTYECAIAGHCIRVCRDHGSECAACTTIGCPEHQRPCADCARPGCIEHALPCAVGKEWTLRIHATECSECRASVCGRHAQPCAICARTLCDLHLLSCVVGNHPVCEADSVRCLECGGVSCANHAARCAVGAHPICGRDRCRVLCADGHEPVCHSHKIACDIGGEELCPHHTKRCGRGGDHLCGTHAHSCEISGDIYCDHHRAACEICSRGTLCESCATASVANGPRVCMSCLGATDDDVDIGLFPRPWIYRFLTARPLVSRSRTKVVITSVSTFRPNARTYELGGMLVEVKPMSREVARSYRELNATFRDTQGGRTSSTPPDVST